MEKLIDLIKEEIKKAFLKAGYKEEYGKVSVSNRPDLCQYQCNGAMAAAKAYKKAPMEIANHVVEQLKESMVFEQVEVASPGFINLVLDNSYLVAYLNEMKKTEKFGCKAKKEQTILVDYGGANVAKPLHIGHLRSAIIGESVKRTGKYLGYHMIGDVHLGDWGLQMGIIIEELRDRKPELLYFQKDYIGQYPEEAPFTIGELEEIYPAGSKKSKLDESFKKRANEATALLQEGYQPYHALWKHILLVSLTDLKKNYGNLNVTFDLWKGESDAQPYIPTMIEDLIEKGLAYESEGALVVDVCEETDTKELPPCIVRKSDGAALYSTSDLATLIEREKEYQPSRYIYLADKRQQLHFTQVFRVAKKAGIVRSEAELIFLGFGTMNGKDGKPFKTRDGGTMRLETLIAEINEEVLNRIMENRTIEESEARKTAEIVGLSALKYGDLSNQASKDYVFDMERFTSFEGNTGPYILYTIVRIKSILAKYQEEVGVLPLDCLIHCAYSQSEIDLMLEMTRFQETIESAFEETAPHKICQYVYELANVFNKFYHENFILSEKDKEKQTSWLVLISLVNELLLTSIDLLGIEAPDRM